MSRYNIIWIDDEWQKQSTFIDMCREMHDIDITPFTTSKDGMNALEADLMHWHGVILDAKVFDKSENEVAKLTGFQNSIKKIEALSYRRIIPYFISTGQPDLMSDKNFAEQWGVFYKKGTDDDKLIKDIITAAKILAETTVRNKYSDVLSVSKDIDEELVKLLVAVEEGVTNDPNYLNMIRKILEWIRGKFQNNGLLPKSVNELNSFSKYACDNIAPISIQRSLHAAIVVSQEGSHRLTIDEEIKSGISPYLLRSTTFELLNVILWVGRLFSNETELEQLKSIAATKDAEMLQMKEQSVVDQRTILYEGVVEKDAAEKIYCGEHLLSDKNEHLVGKRIKVTERVYNTNSNTKHKYLYFMHKYELK